MVLDEAEQAGEQRRPLQEAGSPPRWAPPSVMWLPPPDPAMRPSSRYFSACRPACKAASNTCSMSPWYSRIDALGGTLTSSTPGSGVTDSAIASGARGGG